jgi:hypothetical protein
MAMSEEEQIGAIIKKSLEESASESNDEIDEFEDTEEEEVSTTGKFNSIAFGNLLLLIILNYLL